MARERSSAKAALRTGRRRRITGVLAMPSVSLAAAVVAALVSVAAAASAQPAMPSPPPLHPGAVAAPMTGGSPAPAAAGRFGSAGPYSGVRSFDSSKLMSALAGDHTQAEVASLQQRYGADQVKSFLNVFDFAAGQFARYVAAGGLSWPAAPVPDPANGKGLTVYLYRLGLPPGGRFDVEYLLDRLFSHDVHVKVMDEIDANFGRAADANFHAVLGRALVDLNATYGS
jgi:hypothetical protein